MENRYRILITVSELVYSSQVRNLYDLVSLLDRNVFDIEIGTLATGDAAHDMIKSLGVKVFRLRLQPTRDFSFSKYLNLPKSAFVIASKQYDLVHSLLYQSFFTEPFLFKLLTKTKYIYTKSNIEWDNHPINWRLKSRLADRIISISGATDNLLDNHGFGDKKSKIFLGIDTNYFVHSEKKCRETRIQNNIPPDAMVYGCAAQFIEIKEHRNTIRAFNRLAADNPNVYLVFCGPDHNDKYYKDVVADCESSPYKDRIRLLGTLSDMPAFYSTIDCFVLPSRHEAFGYVYVEAMSCGLPVIGCRAEGPLDIIEEGITGYFTEIADPDDLAKQMNRYLKSPELLEEQGTSARKRAIGKFSKEAMVRETQSLYLETLKKA